MGVYVDELLDLLPQEILAGICFDCQENGARDLHEHGKNALLAAHEMIRSLPEIRRKWSGMWKPCMWGTLRQKVMAK